MALKFSNQRTIRRAVDQFPKPFDGFTPLEGVHNYGVDMLLVYSTKDETTSLHMVCCQTNEQFCEPVDVTDKSADEALAIFQRKVRQINRIEERTP